MALTISIRQVMAIQEADLVIGRDIAFICGPNESGKSTISECAAAALTGNPLIRGVSAKNKLGAVVRDGYDKGSVTVKADDGATRITWPEGKVETTGTPLAVSRFAVGAESLGDLSPKELASALIELLGAEPTEEDLTSALSESGLKSETAAKVWNVTVDQGDWDGAHDRFKVRGAKIKGQWEAATHDRYGSAKGESWLPANWSPALAKESRDALETKIGDAKANLEKVIATQAVDKDALVRDQEKAARRGKVEEGIQTAREGLPALQDALAAAEKHWVSLPTVEAATSIPCPYGCGDDARKECVGHMLTVVKDGPGYMIARAPKREALSKADAEARVKAIDKAKKLMTERQAELDVAREELAGMEADLRTIAAAEQRLQGGEGGESTPDDLNAAREAVRVAEADLDAWISKDAADRYHKGIGENQAIIDVLAPDGLRRTVMMRGLATFNERLAKLSAQYGLDGKKIAQVDEDLDVRLGSRGYRFLSRGAQLTCNAILRSAVAMTTNAPLVIIDGGEVLDGERKAGLFRMLSTARVPAIVTAAVGKRDKATDIGRMKIGATYWLENGYLGPLDKGAPADA